MEDESTKKVKEIVRKCSHCGDEKLQRIEGLFALTKVDKNENGISFMPASGIPVVAYICTSCGELKLIPAKLLEEI